MINSSTRKVYWPFYWIIVLYFSIYTVSPLALQSIRNPLQRYSSEKVVHIYFWEFLNPELSSKDTGAKSNSLFRFFHKVRAVRSEDNLFKLISLEQTLRIAQSTVLITGVALSCVVDSLIAEFILSPTLCSGLSPPD